MNFHVTKKLLQMVSHELWALNRKIIFHGIRNPIGLFKPSLRLKFKKTSCGRCYSEIVYPV